MRAGGAVRGWPEGGASRDGLEAAGGAGRLVAVCMRVCVISSFVTRLQAPH